MIWLRSDWISHGSDFKVWILTNSRWTVRIVGEFVAGKVCEVCLLLQWVTFSGTCGRSRLKHACLEALWMLFTALVSFLTRPQTTWDQIVRIDANMYDINRWSGLCLLRWTLLERPSLQCLRLPPPRITSVLRYFQCDVILIEWLNHCFPVLSIIADKIPHKFQCIFSLNF